MGLAGLVGLQGMVGLRGLAVVALSVECFNNRLVLMLKEDTGPGSVWLQVVGCPCKQHIWQLCLHSRQLIQVRAVIHAAVGPL